MVFYFCRKHGFSLLLVGALFWALLPVPQAAANNNCKEVRDRAYAEGRIGPGRTEPGVIIGRVVAIFKNASLKTCSEPNKKVVKGMPIEIDDCLTTGPRTRVRIQFADRNEARNVGPSVLNVGPSSKVCFTQFWALESITIGRDGQRRALIDIFRGGVRAFFKGFGKNSSFDVRAGVALCGIRGSDGAIFYKPEKGKVTALLNEGHMSVKTPSGRVDLRPGETVSVKNGVLKKKKNFTRDKWEQIINAVFAQPFPG